MNMKNFLLLMTALAALPAFGHNVNADPGGNYHFEYLQTGDSVPQAVQVFDDGKVTYFQFNANTKTPAIFVISCGKSTLLNPSKNGIYVVVPGVYKYLQTRLGMDVTEIKYIGKSDVRNNYCTDVGQSASGPATVYSEVLPSKINGPSTPTRGDSTNPLAISSADASHSDSDPNKPIPSVTVVTHQQLEKIRSDEAEAKRREEEAKIVPYLLNKGSSMEAQVLEWAKRDGWTVKWNLLQDWIVSTNTNFGGDFKTAIKSLVETLAKNGADVRADIYGANRTVVIHSSSGAE